MIAPITIFTLLLASCSQLAAAADSSNIFHDLSKRQSHGKGAFIPGTSPGCPSDWPVCGTSHTCYNPAQGDTCCPGGTFACPGGSFCLLDPYCCPNGLDPKTCAAQFNLTLPSSFFSGTATAVATDVSSATSSASTISSSSGQSAASESSSSSSSASSGQSASGSSCSCSGLTSAESSSAKSGSAESGSSAIGSASSSNSSSSLVSGYNSTSSSTGPNSPLFTGSGSRLSVAGSAAFVSWCLFVLLGVL